MSHQRSVADQVFVSPGLVLLLVGSAGGGGGWVDVGTIFLKLGMTVIVPMVLGEIVQALAPAAVQALRARVNFTVVSQCALLLFVYALFCNTFTEQITLVRRRHQHDKLGLLTVAGGKTVGATGGGAGGAGGRAARNVPGHRVGRDGGAVVAPAAAAAGGWLLCRVAKDAVGTDAGCVT
jgi:hypothetical protein